MHEGLTLGKQLENKIRRGGSLDWSALPDPAMEFVIYKVREGAVNPLDFEIFEAERAKGIADCVGRWQGKWGTQIRATDPSPLHSALRGLKELFGWEMDYREFNLTANFVGMIGPWFHRSTVRLDGDEPVLSVLEEQGEETAFTASLFILNAMWHDVDPSAGYAKATKDARWISVKQLISERGQDTSYLYWSTIALAMRSLRGGGFKRYDTYFPPGEHRF